MQSYKSDIEFVRKAVAENTALINKRTNGLVPKIGIILGSGLGDFIEQLQNTIIISYKDLTGFPVCSVEGHHGQLCFGKLNDIPVVCFQGRAHLYEGIPATTIPVMIRTLKMQGCETLIVTNSAGSLRPDLTSGLMLISDHINMQFSNPLVGENDEQFGPKFVGMEDAYDPELRQLFMKMARSLDIHLPQGVYIGVIGPSFETPAEIRAFRTLGADAVGMSTIHEVIVARHCDLRVAAISVITNLAAGMSEVKLSHKVTLTGAAFSMQQLTNLIVTFVTELYRDKQ